MNSTREAAPENSENSPEAQLDVRLHRLITSREKMPHDPRWLAARKQTLWRYLARQQAARAAQIEEKDASEPNS